MALLDSPRSKSIVAILFAVLLGYVIYSGDGMAIIGFSGLKAGQSRASAMQDSISVLTAQTDSVKRRLAAGSAEDLKKQTESYRETLDTLRRLVPAAGEVPGLIDAISMRAKIRGVHLAVFTPEPVENGPIPFDTYRYRLSVIGHYDNIGEFLADVAGLSRIIVPINMNVAAANAASARALGDTSKAMLEARFLVKTFVKSSGPERGTP